MSNRTFRIPSISSFPVHLFPCKSYEERHQTQTSVPISDVKFLSQPFHRKQTSFSPESNPCVCVCACACMCVCMCLCVHACVYGNHWDIELIHNSFLGNHNTLFEMCFDDVFLKFSFYVCKTYAKLFYKLNSNFYIPVLF